LFYSSLSFVLTVLLLLHGVTAEESTAEWPTTGITQRVMHADQPAAAAGAFLCVSSIAALHGISPEEVHARVANF
jgi:hypothetical protein